MLRMTHGKSFKKCVSRIGFSEIGGWGLFYPPLSQEDLFSMRLNGILGNEMVNPALWWLSGHPGNRRYETHALGSSLLSFNKDFPFSDV